VKYPTNNSVWDTWNQTAGAEEAVWAAEADGIIERGAVIN